MQVLENTEAINFMGDEDKDVLAGSTMREYKELGKELGTRLGAAERHADAYFAAAQYVRSRNPSNGGLRYGSPMTSLEIAPSPDKVKENCTEVLKLIARRTELFKRLKDMEMEPKDPPVPL